MANIDLSTLDFHSPSTLPLPIKLGVFVLVFVLIIAIAAYFVIWQDGSNWDEYESAVAKENTLKQEFNEKVKRANNIEAYEEQKRKLQSMLQDQLKMLPNSNEVAQLLSDISKTATDNGLKLEKINWAAEVRKDMYTELPMNLVIVGDYAKIGNFTADVADLSRIVVISDFEISHYDNKSEELKMSMTAKTYRYNADQEIGAKSNNGGRK